MSLVMAKSLVKLKELAVKYQDGLDPQEKARYEGKLMLLGGEDPIRDDSIYALRGCQTVAENNVSRLCELSCVFT